MLGSDTYSDLVVIGGGINGTAIAADAAGRGLSVLLCEKNDLASATSSASSKLIHGGLRYLENYEFNMVRKALTEREILLHKASYLISPLEFVLPHEKQLRPAWLIRLGLFLYDHLAAHPSLPNSTGIDLKTDPRGTALLPIFKKGFSYYDCWVDDARLVITNAIAAREHGATILTETQFVSAEKTAAGWNITLKNNQTGEHYTTRTRWLINAAGPWVTNVSTCGLTDTPATTPAVELVKGSHIVVPKMYEGHFAYLLQNSNDGRIVFAMPYQEEFTLIGTTDVNYTSNLDAIQCSDEEKIYLCNTVNHFFKKRITIHDIIWHYAGVRCLQTSSQQNPSEITRDYKLELIPERHLLTVIGGKITTHRRLADDALALLQPYFTKMRPTWTANTPLPGGDFPQRDFALFYASLKSTYAWLPEPLLRRYAKSYGTRAELILKHTTCLADLGIAFGAGLYQKEVDYLIQHEWAKTTDDILWRRTKLGLFLSKQDVEKLHSWMRATPAQH